MALTPLRPVTDTNVLLASEKSKSATSPNREYIQRWRNDEFTFLYSEDTLLEYIKKMQEKHISEDSIKKFLGALFELGVQVYIAFYHLPVYPVDPDDIAFLLCADNGEATHLLTYDRHLEALTTHSRCAVPLSSSRTSVTSCQRKVERRSMRPRSAVLPSRPP